MALLIYVLRYYLYIPLLIQIENKAKAYGQDIRTEIHKYYSKVIQEMNFPCKPEEEIIEFIDWLGEMYQKPSDWCGNYYSKVDYSFEENEEISRNELYKRQLQYIENQNKLVETYLKQKGA